MWSLRRPFTARASSALAQASRAVAHSRSLRSNGARGSVLKAVAAHRRGVLQPRARALRNTCQYPLSLV